MYESDVWIRWYESDGMNQMYCTDVWIRCMNRTDVWIRCIVHMYELDVWSDVSYRCIVQMYESDVWIIQSCVKRENARHPQWCGKGAWCVECAAAASCCNSGRGAGKFIPVVSASASSLAPLVAKLSILTRHLHVLSCYSTHCHSLKSTDPPLTEVQLLCLTQTGAGVWDGRQSPDLGQAPDCKCESARSCMLSWLGLARCTHTHTSL